MIGKIMSEVSHSIIGMLSAKPVGMETQLSKFDLNSLLTSSDDQYASALGQNSIREPGDQKEFRFLEQFVENGVHLKVGSKSLVKADIRSSEQPSSEDLKDASGVVSFLSEANEVLTSSNTPLSEGPHFSKPLVSENSASKETEHESEQPIAQPIRKLANTSFDEWESGFASSTMLDDNFSAVEAAIAKYRLPVAKTDQMSDAPMPVHGQDGVQNSPVSSTETKDTESFDDVTTVPDQGSKSSTTITGPVSNITTTREIDDNDSADQLNQNLAKTIGPNSLSQSYLALDQANPPQLSASISPYSAINLESAGINHETKDRIVSASNATPAPSKAPGLVSDHVFDQPDNFLPRGGQSSAKPAKILTEKIVQAPDRETLETVSHKHQENQPVDQSVSQINRSDSLRDLSSETSNKIVESNRGRINQTQKPISMAEIEVGKSTSDSLGQADKHLASRLQRSEGPAPLSINRNAQASPGDDLEPAATKQDEKQLNVPAFSRSSLQPDRPGSLRAIGQPAPVEDNQETNRSNVTMVPSNALKRPTEDKKMTSRDIARDLPSAAAASELEKPAMEPKILDSINLRLANKIAVDRPMGTRLETDIAVSETGIEKQAANNLELPPASVEKSVPMTTPAHLLNLTTLPTVHKTVNFDWNRPQFAERFAAEISDLSTHGDLKRFEINPRNLGRLEVAFVARGGTEFIRIEAESQVARDVIVQHSQVIQDMLKAQGRSDLTVRVDIKDQGFSSASDNGGPNFAQQDETGPRDDRPKSQSKDVSTLSSDIGVESDVQRDEGRYA